MEGRCSCVFQVQGWLVTEVRMAENRFTITCKICRQFYILAEEEEGNLPHLLQCGHVYCAACLNLLKSPFNTITCPDCKLETSVDEDGVDGLQVDSKTIGLIYTAKIKKSREDRQKTNAEKALAVTGSGHTEKDAALKKAVDHALIEAIKNQSQLQSIHERLAKGLKTQVRTEKKRLLAEISEMTEKAICVVQKRKVALVSGLGELDHCFSEIRRMLQEVEQKKKSLESAIAKAENLNSPVLQEYCNAEQVLEALRAPVDMQAFDLSCLTQVTGLGCSLDSEKLEQALSMNQGNSVSTEHMTPRFKRSSRSSVESRGSLSRPKTPSPPSAADWQQEYQGIQNAQSNSSPNVIIEEIFEDSPGVSASPIQMAEPKQQEGQRKPKGTQNPMPPAREEKVCLLWVVVTHVVNPAHFYVRYVSEQRAGTHLSRKINTFCMGSKCMFSSSNVVKKGDLLFVRWKPGLWCRAQVLDLFQVRNEEAVRQCLATDIASLKVFFLDYGFIKGLTIASGEALVGLNEVLRRPDRNAQVELSRWPQQAIRCGLNGIVPVQMSGWSNEACKEFRNVTGSVAVRMQVFGNDKGTLLVDLKKAPMDHINSRMPISLRDHLVFLEHARFHSPVTAGASCCKPLQYYPPVLPKPKSEFCAIVSHISTPSDFFIQMTENMEFPLLASKLQAFYGAHKEGLQLHCPMLEQACVAPHDNNEWHRALITGFHGMRMAEVQLVDVGIKRVVAVSDLRVIKDEFLSLPAMAIWCCLADMECDGDYWRTPSINRFRDLAEKRLVTVLTKKFMSCYGPLPVCLFEGDDQRESRSIAGILITEGLARRPKNTRPVAPEVSVWDPPLERVEAEPSAMEMAGGIQLSPSIIIPASQKDIEVKVTHVTSPANIYVQLSQYNRQLKRLQDQLQQEFGRSAQMSIDWEVGMACGALINAVWERGEVSAIINSNMLEVLRCDFGNCVNVPVDNLRPLPTHMIGSFLIECCLSGIRPAGGPKWTATSCDLISYYLTGATAVMTIKEPPPAEPIGVSLFCSNRAGQNVSVADYLISEGLALPKRKSRSVEINFGEVLEPKLVEGLPALEVTSDEPVPLPEEMNTSADDLTCEIPPSTDAYPPPEPPVHLGHTRMSITAVGDDGVIYGMTSQAEDEFERLKKRLQQHIKATPVLNHHNWRSVKGCIIKGTDMLWHRGLVVELIGGQVKVQYVDQGQVENIPACHVYPMVVCDDVPQLCLPLRLHRGKPVGKEWHHDAVALIKETVLGRRVDVQIMELPIEPRECTPIEIFLDGMPLSRILAHHQPTCINISAVDFEEQVITPLVDLDDWNLDTKGLLDHPPLLGTYADHRLPKIGKRCPVKIKHLCTPNKVYLNVSREEDNDVSLEEVLECVNADMSSLSPLTDFPIGGPCLAEYSDGRFYRAEFTGFVSISPEIKMLIRHVDFGSDDTLSILKLRCLPECLLDFPRQAVCVRLAGFQPPRFCSETKRLPYAPEWSVKALLEMMNLLQQKGVFRALIAAAGEESVAYLYNPDGTLVHHSLVKRGLADYLSESPTHTPLTLGTLI
ncbi:RING finger protein 17 isoform X2 [Alosa sapidissima]|uniref:RING finger protein 17 isoform X2 n=1 Tax=Alosa sapidissima TaxID=34773 RepID=UPI001C0954DC|nr:RING finger protein 17 isoform X2 [Alosa sapidissima]